MFDFEKSVEVLIYISKRSNNLINIMKILYFADKDHIGKNGRFITGDKYIAIDHGPVPSGMYDIIKFVRGDGKVKFDEKIKENIFVKNNKIIQTTRMPNMDYLSDSDVESLDIAINEIKSLSFSEIKEKLKNESPYTTAKDQGKFNISQESIISDLPNSKEVFEYLDS